MALFIFLSSYLALASAQINSNPISGDHNCTQWAPNEFTYTWQAVGCSDVMDEAYCKNKYHNIIYPAEGGNWNRAQACYMSGSEISVTAKSWAISFCPKTCGFCCETYQFNCLNKNQKIACHTVTQAQCKDPTWRHFLADECPSTCGYCFYPQCVDLVPECMDDPRICDEPTLKQFVEWNCRRTCKKCVPVMTSTSTMAPRTKEFTRPLLVF